MNNINVKNRTVFCRDNLEILQGINSNCIDLIYIDPPFNKKKVFTAPIGSSAEGASFKDWFKEEDVKNEWLLTIKEDNDKLCTFLESVKTIEGKTSYNFCYLSYMAIRIIELHRILKDTGSFYLHCDPTMSHYLKILLDIIFGEKNFRSEIVWERSKSGKTTSKNFSKDTDNILFFSKDNQYIFNYTYKPLSKNTLNSYIYDDKDNRGKYASFSLQKTSNPGHKTTYDYIDNEGKIWKCPIKGWRMNKDKLKKLENDRRLILTGSVIREKKYWIERENKGKLSNNLWNDINNIQGNSKEKTDYPTQKPLALLERIIKASSKEGDVVLDAFCGCATTCVASEKLNRQWIGIDVSFKAYDLVRKRLEKEIKEGKNALLNWNEEINFFTNTPIRTDDNREDKREKKYVYVISHPSYKGFYKVGIAKDYKARLNSYQTSDPLREYKLEYRIHTHLFRAIEKHIHNTFDNLLEWVHASKRDIIKQIENY